MSGPYEYYSQCNCFCGCSTMCGPSVVPLRGHVECQRCFDGECVNEHYEKTHKLCGIENCTRIARHLGPHWKTSDDVWKSFSWAFERIMKAH
jgi:hypothetical protein